VALVLISLFTPMFSSAVQNSALGGLDAGLGFLFGVARGALLVVVALIAYDRIAGDEPIAAVSDAARPRSSPRHKRDWRTRSRPKPPTGS
jgi:membrane protein required for colicin V production